MSIAFWGLALRGYAWEAMAGHAQFADCAQLIAVKNGGYPWVPTLTHLFSELKLWVSMGTHGRPL